MTRRHRHHHDHERTIMMSATPAARRRSPVATSFIALMLSFVVILGLAALLDVTLFTSAADRHAVLVSADIAYAVQFIGFEVLLLLRKWNVVAAWGLSAMLRFAALAAYALLAIKPLGLPPLAALCSLVTFFFVTTLAEPWLIRS
jgi:hypothetical protein